MNSRLSTQPWLQIQRCHSQLELSKGDCGGTPEGLTWFLLCVNSSENRALYISQVNKMVDHLQTNSEQSCICSLMNYLLGKENLNSILFTYVIFLLDSSDSLKMPRRNKNYLQWTWEFKYLFAARLKIRILWECTLVFFRNNTSTYSNNNVRIKCTMEQMDNIDKVQLM